MTPPSSPPLISRKINEENNNENYDNNDNNDSNNNNNDNNDGKNDNDEKNDSNNIDESNNFVMVQMEEKEKKNLCNAILEANGHLFSLFLFCFWSELEKSPSLSEIMRLVYFILLYFILFYFSSSPFSILLQGRKRLSCCLEKNL